MALRPGLPNLTSIRFFAATYVFCYHFFSAPFWQLGYTGVNLFFVLSGFILAYNYPVVSSIKRFYAMRFARIYPLYALALILSLPSFVHTVLRRSPEELKHLPLAFLLLQTWWPPAAHVLNGAAWTLSVEAFFYVSFPWLLPRITRLLPHWKGYIAFVSLLQIAPPLLVYFLSSHYFPSYEDISLKIIGIPLFFLGEFIVGMLLGRKFLQKKPSFSAWQAFLAALFFLVTTLAACHIPKDRTQVIYNGLMTIPYGVLIYVLAGWRSRWFGHPLLQLGGEISYGMYLLQFPCYALMRVGMGTPEVPVTALFAVLLITSYLCYQFVEKPGRLFILSLLGFHASPKPIPTPSLQV